MAEARSLLLLESSYQTSFSFACEWLFGAREERNLLETTVEEIQNRRASNRPGDPRMTDDQGLSPS